jgi:phage terminase large subunit-like protein
VSQIHPLEFFNRLRWLDGRTLLDTIEDYRRQTFERLLYTFDTDGRPRYNQALIGRAKKNNKTLDLVLSALYRFLIWETATGNSDCFVIANDEDQAGDDLDLTKKIDCGQPHPGP